MSMQSAKGQSQVCARCGAALKHCAMGRLCPSCMLQGGLHEPGPGAASGADPVTCGSPTASAASLPQCFGGYELLEIIARGGMGVVYKARQKSLNRIVAVKMLLSGQFAEPKFVQRFRAEAEAVAQLQHPNIVVIHEIGECEGQPFFSMDYVEGKNLAQMSAGFGSRGVEFHRCADLLKTIAEAVHYAHERGIIHRDLKPSNVLIDSFGRPRITDFGLAKRLTGDSDLTLSGQVLGSPNYLPPEQAEPKRGKVGAASDVYALGAILYHLVTGRPPFQADSLTTLLRQVIEAEPVAPRSLNPSIPRDLETICLKCLEKDAPRRYQTAQQMADEIGRFLEGKPILARPANAAGKVLRWCRRQPALAGLSAGLVLSLVSGLTVALWQMQRARTGESLALRQVYASDMNLVQRSIEEGDLGSATKLLNKHRPGEKAGDDLRGWEWRYLWGRLRSDEQYRLTQQSKPFVSLALAPDGDLLALRQERGDIQLWDLAKRQLVGTLTNRGDALAMAFSADGRFIASANQNAGGTNVVSFWDIGTRQILRNLPQPSAVLSLALSPDGKHLATFNWDPRVRLWEIESGKLILDLPASEAVNTAQRIPLFSPDGKTLALGEMQGQIRLLDLATRAIREIPPPMGGNGVSALAFSPDSRLLASGHGQSDGTIRLWDVTTMKQVGNFDGHRSYVTKLVFAPNGQTLYSASADQSICVWDIGQRKPMARLQGHTSGLSGLALCRDQQTLVSCAEDGSVRVWDPRLESQQRFQAVLPVQVGGIFGAVFTSDSRRLITASLTNEVTSWDCATGKETERIPAFGTNNLSIALSPDERLLAVGDREGTLKIWDTQKHHLVREWKPHSLPILKLCFLAGGKSLLSLAMNPHQPAEAKWWEIPSWRESRFDLLEGKPCYGISQSANCQLVAFCSGGESLTVWDSIPDRMLASIGHGGLSPALSPDNRLIAGTYGRGARIWELVSGRQLAVLEQSANEVTSVTFSPDGKRLVTGFRTGGNLQPALRVWDYKIERVVLSLYSHGNWSGWTGFSPDGNTLVTIGWFGTVDLYHAPSWEEIEAAEKGAR